MAVRVACTPGKMPPNCGKGVILVAPHAVEEPETGLIVEHAAKLLKCQSVVNWGFQRDCALVDVNKDQADCNKCSHVKEPVVYDEFLKPLYKGFDKSCEWFHSHHRWFDTPVDDTACLIFYVLGCSNEVIARDGCTKECIVGWGKGSKKDSPTCKQWRKNLFINTYRDRLRDLDNNTVQKLGDVVEGDSAAWSGRGTEEMNQFFRKHNQNRFIDSLQLYYPKQILKNNSLLPYMGLTLVKTIEKVREAVSYDQIPYLKTV